MSSEDEDEDPLVHNRILVMLAILVPMSYNVYAPTKMKL
jgi:hypothetical protein